MDNAGSSQLDRTGTKSHWRPQRNRARLPSRPLPHLLGTLALLLSPLMPLLAVGPIFITLVNFKVESLVYILTYRHWAVSGGPAQVPWAYGGGGGRWRGTGQPHPRMQTGAYVCMQKRGTCVCVCMRAQGESKCVCRARCGSLTVGCPPWGKIHPAESAGHVSPRQGFPHPTHIHSPFTSKLSPVKQAGKDPVPLP